jgi:hypothetical protein
LRQLPATLAVVVKGFEAHSVRDETAVLAEKVLAVPAAPVIRQTLFDGGTRASLGSHPRLTTALHWQ